MKELAKKILEGYGVTIVVNRNGKPVEFRVSRFGIQNGYTRLDIMNVTKVFEKGYSYIDALNNGCMLDRLVAANIESIEHVLNEIKDDVLY
jgi:hypothetical protein